MPLPTDLDDRPTLSRIAGSFLGTGALLALLGGLALAAPWAAATMVDAIWAGALIAGGVFQLWLAFGTSGWRGFWVALVCGALSIVAGTAMIAIPVEGIHVLTMFVGLLFLFEAAARLTAAFSVPRDFPWGWLLVDGLVTALLGGILLTSRADQSGWLLGTLVGVNLLSSGISALAAGWWLKRGVA